MSDQESVECFRGVMTHFGRLTLEDWRNFLLRFVLGEFGKLYNNLSIPNLFVALREFVVESDALFMNELKRLENQPQTSDEYYHVLHKLTGRDFRPAKTV
jgi:hypothetical protein